MNKLSRRTTKVLAATATPLAILGAGAMVYQSSYAAFSGTTRNSGNDFSTGTVALSDDDNGASRFQVTNMLPGQTDTKCITVTSNATAPGVVKGYVVNPQPSSAGLEDRIKFTVDEGNGGSFASCNGFTFAKNVIPAGTSMTQMFAANSYNTALGGWSVPTGTSSRTYKISWTFDTTGMTQTDIDRLQNTHTGFDFQWELQSS